MDVTVTSDDVAKLVRSIHLNANPAAMRREFARGLNRATKPVRDQMAAQVPSALPNSGGLAAAMQSKVRSSTSTRSRGLTAAVSIRFRARDYDIRTLTSGQIRHPVYGNRGSWVSQTAGVNPEAFTGEFEKQRPTALREVGRVVDEIARKVTNI